MIAKDSERPTVHIKVAGYENIYFDCPHCNAENTFNRATDLGPLAMTSGMETHCQQCHGRLWLTNDRVQMAQHHWFLQELPLLKDRKLYRDYTLTLCQGAESFFLQAVVNKQFDRSPEYRDSAGRFAPQKYRTDLASFHQKVKPYTFSDMRTLFLNTFRPEIENATERINIVKEDKRDWADSVVRKSKINGLRNRVVHKYAYRPSLSDIEEHDELIDAIYWFGIYLDVLDSNFARIRPTL